MNKKNQHVIPRCYLEPWCAKDTPEGHTPSLWLISRDGKTRKRRAPRNTFAETDMYTIKLEDGTRNLIIEDTLGGIESQFSQVVEKVINSSQHLTDHDRAVLCAFTAAMSVRTQGQKENFTSFFSRVHRLSEDMEKAHGIPPTKSQRLAKLRDNAQPFIIGHALDFMTQILFKMSLALLITDDPQGFITSDAPCVWYNPKLPRHPIYGSPGLGQKNIEVRLPITPSTLAFFSWRDFHGYHMISDIAVDELNRFTRWYCEEYFITLNADIKPFWFEQGGPSEDTLGKT